MITKKEELINTYIENDHGELRDLYLSKCEDFGFLSNSGRKPTEMAESSAPYFGMTEIDGSLSYSTNWSYADNGCKKLTLSDLKPRTKVEYEKVTGSIFDLRDEFERGELVSKVGGQISEIKTESYLVTQYGFGYVHRKVERPVEWWEDAAEFVKENACNMNAIARNLADDGLYVEAKMTRDQWCDFARILLEQEGE